jgi:hypothetical protein
MIFNHALHYCFAFLRAAIRGASVFRFLRNRHFVYAPFAWLFSLCPLQELISASLIQILDSPGSSLRR